MKRYRKPSEMTTAQVWFVYMFTIVAVALAGKHLFDIYQVSEGQIVQGYITKYTGDEGRVNRIVPAHKHLVRIGNSQEEYSLQREFPTGPITLLISKDVIYRAVVTKQNGQYSFYDLIGSGAGLAAIICFILPALVGVYLTYGNLRYQLTGKE